MSYKIKDVMLIYIASFYILLAAFKNINSPVAHERVLTKKVSILITKHHLKKIIKIKSKKMKIINVIWVLLCGILSQGQEKSTKKCEFFYDL